MNKKKKTPTTKLNIEPLNDEAMKGVWVDGIEAHISQDYTILDGIITKPRTEKAYVVSRIMFPTRILGPLTEILRKAVENIEQKKSKGQ